MHNYKIGIVFGTLILILLVRFGFRPYSSPSLPLTGLLFFAVQHCGFWIECWKELARHLIGAWTYRHHPCHLIFKFPIIPMLNTLVWIHSVRSLLRPFLAAFGINFTRSFPSDLHFSYVLFLSLIFLTIKPFWARCVPWTSNIVWC